MTRDQLDTLFSSANMKVTKKEELKTLTKSKLLKSDMQKEIAKLNHQIFNVKNELLEITKENKENTEKIIELLFTYLINDDKDNFKNLLENHLLFNSYSEKFYDHLFKLNPTEKQLAIDKLSNWINKYTVSGLKVISIDLEKHLI